MASRYDLSGMFGGKERQEAIRRLKGRGYSARSAERYTQPDPFREQRRPEYQVLTVLRGISGQRDTPLRPFVDLHPLPAVYPVFTSYYELQEEVDAQVDEAARLAALLNAKGPARARAGGSDGGLYFVGQLRWRYETPRALAPATMQAGGMFARKRLNAEGAPNGGWILTLWGEQGYEVTG